MVVLNKNLQETAIKTDRLTEMLSGCTSAKEVISGKTFNNLEKITLPAKSISVFELR
jgi:hypothetical protein